MEELFASFPVMRAGGAVSDDEIDHAEATLGVAFDADYRWFVKRYGGAMVGSLPVYGLRATELIGEDEMVINQTRRYRSGGVPPDWIIVSNDGFGNVIGMTSDGRVRLSDHETGAIVDIAESFEELVLKLLDERLFG